MIGDVNLPQQQQYVPEPESSTLAGNQGSATASSTRGASQRLKTVKQLSFRIDGSTHHRISLAAQRAGKNSINAWMEEVLSAAADDVLESSKDAVVSEEIQTLLEDPVYVTRLIEGVAPYLRDHNPTTVFQFSHALKKLLIGWDLIRPFIEAGNTDLPFTSVQDLSQPSFSVTKLAVAVVPLLQETDSVTVLRYSWALKKLLLGFAAVAPFVKEVKTDNLLRIAGVIESLLEEIQE